MRLFNIVLMAGCAVVLVSCGQKAKKATDAMQVADTSVMQVNVLDSLKQIPDLGQIVERNYVGEIPAADCPGIIYDITFYNQVSATDGVYASKMTYLEAEDGKDMTFDSYGRWSTIVGDSTDKSATVYELKEFNSSYDPSYMLYLGDSVEMLTADKARITSGLNYTLRIRK